MPKTHQFSDLMFYASVRNVTMIFDYLKLHDTDKIHTHTFLPRLGGVFLEGVAAFGENLGDLGLTITLGVSFFIDFGVARLGLATFGVVDLGVPGLEPVINLGVAFFRDFGVGCLGVANLGDAALTASILGETLGVTAFGAVSFIGVKVLAFVCDGVLAAEAFGVTLIPLRVALGDFGVDIFGVKGFFSLAAFGVLTKKVKQGVTIQKIQFKNSSFLLSSLWPFIFYILVSRTRQPQFLNNNWKNIKTQF